MLASCGQHRGAAQHPLRAHSPPPSTDPFVSLSPLPPSVCLYVPHWLRRARPRWGPSGGRRIGAARARGSREEKIMNEMHAVLPLPRPHCPGNLRAGAARAGTPSRVGGRGRLRSGQGLRVRDPAPLGPCALPELPRPARQPRGPCAIPGERRQAARGRGGAGAGGCRADPEAAPATPQPKRIRWGGRARERARSAGRSAGRTDRRTDAPAHADAQSSARPPSHIHTHTRADTHRNTRRHTHTRARTSSRQPACPPARSPAPGARSGR